MHRDERRAGRRERKWRRYLRARSVIVGGQLEEWQRMVLRKWWEWWEEQV